MEKAFIERLAARYFDATATEAEERLLRDLLLRTDPLSAEWQELRTLFRGLESLAGDSLPGHAPDRLPDFLSDVPDSPEQGKTAVYAPAAPAASAASLPAASLPAASLPAASASASTPAPASAPAAPAASASPVASVPAASAASASASAATPAPASAPASAVPARPGARSLFAPFRRPVLRWAAVAALVAAGLFAGRAFRPDPYCYIDGVAVYDPETALETTACLEHLSRLETSVRLADELLQNL